MLTRKQLGLLNFIKSYQAENGGVSPSFDEMKDAVGICSKSGVHRLITALVERGFVRRIPQRARCLEVVSGQVSLAPTAVDFQTASEIVTALDQARRLATTPENAVDEIEIIAHVLSKSGSAIERRMN